jgi:hypothetical protein
MQIALAEVIPEGLCKFYDRFRFLRQTQIKVVAQRNPNVLKSLRLWDQALSHHGWNTHVNLQDNSSFCFAFQSPWQKEMLLQHGSSMIMMDATHNSVSNYFLSGGAKTSLWTFMIRDPIVGKGLPVAWAFTSSAAE